MKKIFRHWKKIYTVCSIIYIGWVIYVGGNEFDRINSQYRYLKRQQEPDRITSATHDELAAECRRTLSKQLRPQEAACSDWLPSVVEAKRSAVAERTMQARKRGLVKLILFYIGFVAIFLLAPVILVYLLILGITTLYKNIKIVR